MARTIYPRLRTMDVSTTISSVTGKPCKDMRQGYTHNGFQPRVGSKLWLPPVRLRHDQSWISNEMTAELRYSYAGPCIWCVGGLRAAVLLEGRTTARLMGHAAPKQRCNCTKYH